MEAVEEKPAARPAARLRAIAATVLCLFVAFGTMQCAVFNKDNRRLTNTLDRAIDPETTTTKVALAVPTIAIGFISIVTDMVVVHPLASLPRAGVDTYEWIWEDSGGGVVQQTFLLIPKVALSVIVFAGDWVIRSLFDV